MSLKRKILVMTGILFFAIFIVRLNAQNTAGSDSTEHGSGRWDFQWDNGSQLKSSDGRFQIAFGGRIMNDWVTNLSYDQNLEDSLGAATSGTEFRRLRFYHSGTIYKNISFKLQFDFAGGKADLKNTYINLNDIPYIGNLKIGHFKEPFSLTELTSDKYITFMARAITSPFHPQYNSGIAISNDALSGRMTYAAGIFSNSGDFGQYTHNDPKFNVTGRLTGLPYKKENDLLHLGIAYQLRKPKDNTIRYVQEPETHMQRNFVNTGTISQVSNENIMGVEMAGVYGPVSLQGEYQMATLMRDIELNNGADNKEKAIRHNFSSFYTYISVFLTQGDHRFYDEAEGTFDRVKPQKNFRENGSIGALELALRFSGLNLNDGKEKITEGSYTGSSIIEGGKLNDITLGLNWYLNPSTRIMFNYIHADLKNRGSLNGQASFLRTRFQVDF